ncbi:hypothetical protein [Halomonas sp. MCCC 1A11062]|uniref:hypothetical protein n=1 Tax=Halomonas sp. MCCC 1A11062 TaxID=2733485 RepID=UPI001F1DCE4D|nr:hypothetical protein [Halomonas sp. MCCC 1A11062]MCE8036117.1 hypothetical protein [Halomonas sp. MCCC 1A11062]
MSKAADCQVKTFTLNYDARNAWNTRLEAPFWEFDALLEITPRYWRDMDEASVKQIQEEK